MPSGRRKIPFSGKKKKEQILARRAKKAYVHHEEGDEDDELYTTEASIVSEKKTSINYQEEILAVNHQPGASSRVNRYNLKFRKETPAEKAKRQELHSQVVKLAPKTELETTSEYFYPPGLEYPSRPPWKSNMSKRELEASENRHFRLFCENIEKDFSKTELSMFELNLETWRQLWRVTEMSDILLIIVDARFPVPQFPPYLYRHLVEKENKGIILILNKCDLLPPSVILAWQYYFAEHFPKLIVVPFSSMEGRKGKRNLLKMAAESSLSLVDACQRLVDETVNLNKWRRKIEEERDLATNDDDNESVEVLETNLLASQNTAPEVYQRFKDGVLTIGTIGHPNVGKSSLINALMGKKVVSVSKTPGHTKHFQTIFLTKDIRLCDCPGLVFPSTVDMQLQVLTGSFPIAQVRDPISVVHYIASRLDIPSLLKLQHTEDYLARSEWTSFLICEAWAAKRGYRTKKRGMPDVYRGANELLRLCLTGQKSLVVYQRPPGFLKQKAKFESDPQIEKVIRIQGFHADQHEEPVEENDDSQEDEVSDTEEEDDENESDNEDSPPLTALQNKFALLPDED